MTSTETHPRLPAGDAPAGVSFPGRPTAPRRGEAIRRTLREHWPVIVVLALGALVRAWTGLEYSALVHPDSSNYVYMAFYGTPVMFAADRPSGYALLVKVLTLGGNSLVTLTVAQHLAGLVGGLLVYVLLRRLDAPRGAATLATAVVVLDSYAVTLNEQVIMAEAFFSFALTASVFLAVAARRRPWMLLLSGVFLACAATIRSMGIFAIPVFLLYVLWAGRGWRPRALAVAGVAAPLLLYAAGQAASTGYFGLTQASGWFLYGRVATVVTCEPRDAAQPQSLCRISGERGRARGFHKAEDYIFKPFGPAVRELGPLWTGNLQHRETTNGVVRHWALAMIRDHPGQYAGGVAADFANYLRPPDVSVADSNVVSEPTQPLFGGFGKLPAKNRASILNIWRVDFPWYKRDVLASSPLHSYQRWLEVPGWLVAWLSMLALLVAVVATVARRGFAHRREAVLLNGSGLAILLGAVAASGYQDRFLPSVLPLLVAGVALTASELVRAIPRSSR